MTPACSGVAGVGATLVLLSFPEALKSGASRALHLAAAAGHVPIVRVLLRHGVEVDATDETGSTALHVAAGRGQLAAVRCLLLILTFARRLKWDRISPGARLAMIVGRGRPSASIIMPPVVAPVLVAV